MKKLELIKELEKWFLEEHNNMDKANKEYIKMHLDKDFTKVQLYATKSCLIADVLALINDTNEEKELERLYNKYNLWKTNSKEI